MAKGSNGDGRTPKTPARRRSPKATQAAQAPDSLGARSMPASPTAPAGAVSLSESQYRPTPAEVQRRAYELYLKRGGGHGRDLEDWLEAERQLRSQHGKEARRA